MYVKYFFGNNPLFNNLIEGYQNNKPPPDRPDELQFLACSDNNKVNFGNREIEFVGNNNYKLKQRHIGQPLVGTYTSFIDTYGIRNYDEFFTSYM